MYRLLIVEDDKTLNDTLSYSLSHEGYQVTPVYTATALDTAGIAAGNLTDCIISYLIQPDGWRWPDSTFLAVYISTQTPVKRPARLPQLKL